MAKPTSLAAQLTRQDQEANRVSAKEDVEAAERPAPKGKVWVRLIRPHYDSEGILHMPGIVSLNEGFVPESAKRLIKADQAAADDDE
jgi:hypothetical protein